VQRAKIKQNPKLLLTSKEHLSVASINKGFGHGKGLLAEVLGMPTISSVTTATMLLMLCLFKCTKITC
jgi:hypothetical protein